MQAEFWNDRYLNNETVYGTLPNAFFQQCIDLLNPGKILLPAEGEGRNAVYAAKKGWQAAAFDFSSTARRKALQLAELNSVNIDYEVADFMTYDAENQSMDAIALIYAHMQPDLRQAFHHKIKHWIKPGGSLILEAFNPMQLGLSSGGPKEPAMLYSPEILQQDFPKTDWEIKILENLETTLHEGPFHEGKAQVVRLLAVKR